MEIIALVDTYRS